MLFWKQDAPLPKPTGRYIVDGSPDDQKLDKKVYWLQYHDQRTTKKHAIPKNWFFSYVGDENL